MKIIAAVFATLFLVVGCATGQGATMPTATVALPAPTEAVITEPTPMPTETSRIAPRREKTEAVTNRPQDAYPPEGPPIMVTPLPSDYPMPLVENTYTPAPTPTPLTSL